MIGWTPNYKNTYRLNPKLANHSVILKGCEQYWTDNVDDEAMQHVGKTLLLLVQEDVNLIYVRCFHQQLSFRKSFKLLNFITSYLFRKLWIGCIVPYSECSTLHIILSIYHNYYTPEPMYRITNCRKYENGYNEIHIHHGVNRDKTIFYFWAQKK